MKDIIEIARRAHAGQTDKAGRDYFDAHLTPIAEAASVFGPDAEAAGWLHDVLEDTAVTTSEQLAEFGVSPVVVSAVESVTLRPGEAYDGLIDRAAAQPLGRLVKLADNAWNITCNPGLAVKDSAKAESMMVKYHPARVRLLAAAELTESSPEVAAMQVILDRHLARLHG